jgi:hypothetical protein
MNSNGEPPSVLAGRAARLRSILFSLPVVFKTLFLGGAQEVLLRASGKACAPHHIFRDFPGSCDSLLGSVSCMRK